MKNTIAEQINEIIFGEFDRLLIEYDVLMNGNDLDFEKLEMVYTLAEKKTLEYPGIIELSEEEEESFGISKDESAYIIPIGKKKYIALVASRIFSEFKPGKKFEWRAY